ncbi:MAG: A/G-specific adenine glycosylase [Buchnera aphidicola (Schlechtendalia peitan)]
MTITYSFSQLVINWYHEHGRKNLPWKINTNPYKVWISEIMLQQTQVNTVIPYYNKFIKIFPNINILAQSSINTVLNAWSGLGYYTRAHNLYSTAKIIFKKYNGIFPNHFSNIIKLPGIGKTTAGAILSFGFNLYGCILDGNVKRTLLRHFNIRAQKKTIEKKLWTIIKFITPIHNTHKFNQAIIDIGSLICLKSKPKCKICPLKKTCLSLKSNDWSTYPIKNKIQKKIKKKIFFLIIQYKNFILLKKNQFNTIWKGLYCFPIFFNKLEVLEKIQKKNININKQEIFESFVHTLSHIKFLCFSIRIEIQEKFCIKKTVDTIWFNLYNPQSIGLPSPIKKIINEKLLPFLKN